ncbi:MULTISPECIES: molecular chaperone [unclassified Pseudomonas]|uniref:molecular chaperone n=1 Tax=unclassified Pseudomonas TaxID=196821 RepID=UPI00244CC5C6|nr:MULTISPECIES: molecular chaperone [unclassified Pseudomonas]MDG9925593.1 molecular chaperone [Pseudomonas sp. GD04045]MDH0035791.1 molecular chaperone [Pseudomonas sp. GD04019]
MDKQSPHLLLRVPTPDRQGLSFCDANPRELKRWIAALPKANIGETARQLYQSLIELNQLITPSDNRLQLLELLRPEVYFVTSHLERHFLNQSIVLDERPRKVANLCQALQNHMAIGYKLIITQELPRFAKERAQLLTVALQRASHALCGPLIRASQLYCPVPEGLWLELHQLYRIARLHGLQQVQVRDDLARNGKSLSQEQIYLGALLLGCARCNQMRQSGIARLAEALESWSSLASLHRADDPNSLFAIAPQLDGPPRYKSLFGDGERHNLLGLDPHALVDALKEHLLLPPDSSEPRRLQIPEGMPIDLLQHLASAWGDIAERTFQRNPGRGSLTLCIGMSAVHFNLAGKRGFSDVLKQQETPRGAQFKAAKPGSGGGPDVWAVAFDAQRESQWEDGIPMEEIQYKAAPKAGEQPAEEVAGAYPSYELPIVNHSPGGYCLSWPKEVPVQLQAGELLGTQDAPDQGWSVAVVRWIRQVRGGGTQMGIELIAPHAQPCGVQLVRKSEQNSQYLRALLLPEIRVISRPATLITPRLPFQESNKVVINHNGEETRAILSRKQTSTGSFSQFEYRVLDETKAPSGTSVTAPKEPGKGGDEDFDSLWKSL